MNVIGLILGGGVGRRLEPLTSTRSKPAVPLAGRYRLVDIPISNCINSGINSIYLLTQFNSESLHRHVQSTYIFDQFSNGGVRIMAAEQTPSSNGWFQGTADAVRQCIHHFITEEPDLVVILSGDQLYRLDFRDVIKEHLENNADITIATKPVPREEAYDLGIMQIDEHKRITNFAEKPGNTPELSELQAPFCDEERYLASMGIYVFNTKVLIDLLSSSDETDFGKHFIPTAIPEQRCFSYVYDDYWKDIGTIRMFWEANLALTDAVPEFTFYDQKAPIYTRMRFLPPSKINHCVLDRCLLTEGSIISGEKISRSVVGLRAVVREGSVIQNCILMGADMYDSRTVPNGRPLLGIGRNCFIKNAIIDKNVRIGDDVYISPEGKEDCETDMYVIRDGIIVIPKGTVIPSGTKI
jgi:glucose-1-phosphate adenylyltransferase